MTSSRIGNFDGISAGWDKKCRFFLGSAFFSVLFFIAHTLKSVLCRENFILCFPTSASCICWQTWKHFLTCFHCWHTSYNYLSALLHSFVCKYWCELLLLRKKKFSMHFPILILFGNRSNVHDVITTCICLP